MFYALTKILGTLIAILGLSMLPPAFISVLFADGHAVAFGTLAAICTVIGLAGFLAVPADAATLQTRSGFLIVTVCWIVVSITGSLPFIVIGGLDPVTAIFESASGFTTTGSTALPDLEIYPRSLLFFRQEIQWLGGIGIIIAAIALLPMLGIGGMQLMKSETTGPAKSDKIRPRIKHTAHAIWALYLSLTIGCIVAYWLAGMSLFDAVAHSFTTVSTGGFSIYNESLAYFDSPAIETVAIVFMLLGAISFTVHYRAWALFSIEPYTRNAEARTFLYTVAALAILVTAVLVAETGAGTPDAFRLAIFEVVSVITSTGYGIDDFSTWPTLLPVLLIFVSFIGGCAGSTAGGMKVIRFLIMSRQAVIEVTRLIHPRLVRPLKIGKEIVNDSIVRAIWAFFTIYAFVFVVLMLTLMALGLDQVTAFAVVATCINNLGPGLGEVATNFATVSDPVKLVAAFACVLGRLEVLTVFVVLTPGYWRD